MLGKFFIIPTYRISPILSAERWMMSLLTRFETSVLCVHSRDLLHKLYIYVSLNRYIFSPDDFCYPFLLLFITMPIGLLESGREK